MPNPLIIVGIPIRPQGTVRWKWANFVHQTLGAQGIPGCVTEINFTDEGETIPVAYQRLFEIAVQRKAKYILFLEDDIWMPPGGLGHLVETLERPENKDAGAAGGVYFWRAGYNVDWPLITRTEGEPPYLDWTPGDSIEVDWCGQGALLCRVDMLLADKGPWWSSDWRHEGEANYFKGAADLYFFRKIRQNGWRIIVDTRVCCEHQDIETGIVYPRDDEIRARYKRVPGTEFGYEMDNQLLRTSRRELKRKGMNIRGAQSPLRHLMPGVEPVGASPAAFKGVYPNDAIPSADGCDFPGGPVLGLNIGWGGVPPRQDIAQTLAGMFPKGINWENLEHKDGLAKMEGEVHTQTHWAVDDHMLTGIPDARFDVVYAHHVLEHIPYDHTVAALREYLRVLKPKGRLMVFVPDFQYAAQWLAEGKLDTVLYRCGDTEAGPQAFDVTPRRMLWGAQRYPGDFHVNGFTLQSLRNAAFEAGCAAEEVSVSQDGEFALGLIVWKGRSFYPNPADLSKEREIIKGKNRISELEPKLNDSGNGYTLVEKEKSNGKELVK
jgi:SAM-dependent methyltransferase